MKIVQINSECGRGSTGKIAVSISGILNDVGIENYIFYSSNHKSDYPNSIRIGSKLGLRIHQVLSRLFGDQGLHSTFSTYLLIKRIKRIHPDIIQLHNIHGYYLNFRLLFSFLKTFDGRVFWTFHDCWPITGHCTHFILSKCDKWMNGCGCCPSLHSYPYSLFFDKTKKLFSMKRDCFTSLKNLTIITPSVWLSKIVKKSFLKKYDAYTINNGINLDIFRPRQSNFRIDNKLSGKFIILGVASVWSEKKGLDVFVKLANMIDDSFSIVLVGVDNSLIDKIPNNIVKISRTANQVQLAEIYSSVDIFLNPTREDNFPTVNIESLACGTPVLTFATGGSAEIIDHMTGLVIPDDIEKIMTTIMSIKANYYFKRHNCVERAKLYDEKTVFIKYLDKYLNSEFSKEIVESN